MNKRRNVFLMYFIVFLQGFVFYGPIATVYRQTRGISMYDIFLIESISWILMVLLEVPWGWFADRFGYKKTLVISNFILFISKIVFFKAYSFQMFLLERALMSLAFAGISGCDIALLYASIEEGESEKIFGRYNAFATSGYMIGSLMTTFIISEPISKASIDKTGFLTMIPYAVAVVITLFVKDKKVNCENRVKISSNLKSALNNKHIILLVLSIAFIREVVHSIIVFLNQNQYIRSGISMKYFGIFVVIVQIVQLASIKSYRLSNRFGKDKSIQGLLILIIISCISLILTSNPVLSVVFVAFTAMSMSLIDPMVLDIENKSIKTSERATILSIYSMVGNIAAAIVNPVIGKAADVSIVASFEICLVIALLALVMFLIYKKKVIKLNSTIQLNSY